MMQVLELRTERLSVVVPGIPVRKGTVAGCWMEGIDHLEGEKCQHNFRLANFDVSYSIEHHTGYSCSTSTTLVL